MNEKLIFLTAVILIASGCASQDTTGQPETGDVEPDTVLENETDTGSSNQTSSNTTDSEVAATVRYTVSGFQPSEVKIEKGETVRWEAESGTFWIGSNEHPRHTEYEGTSTTEHCVNGEPVSEDVFDQCSQGSTYTFTFNKTGEHGYHNHRYATHEGTVIVE